MDVSNYKKHYYFVRRSDGKEFELTWHSHWSDVKSADGETDTIKWAWIEDNKEQFISHSKGHSYTKEKRIPKSVDIV